MQLLQLTMLHARNRRCQNLRHSEILPKNMYKCQKPPFLTDLQQHKKTSANHSNTHIQNHHFLIKEQKQMMQKLETIFHPSKENDALFSGVPKDATAPRLLQSNIKPSRVGARQILWTIVEESTEHPIGIIIRKKIGKTIQKGTIDRYNKDQEYYWIN